MNLAFVGDPEGLTTEEKVAESREDVLSMGGAAAEDSLPESE